MSTALQIDPHVTRSGHEKTLLRFITAGSVDDGKSTLIGRLLYDSQNVLEDQLAAAGKASERRSGSASGSAGGIDLSLLTDGLRAEREQGITIDVAYRYFATDRRKFILADTPGHEQYTRNMATAASTADLAILLVDARHGLRTQTRRHAHVAALLGVRQFVIAVNKMDLVGYDEAVFRAIERDFREFASSLSGPSLRFIPLSAFTGDHVVTRSRRMPWFDGQPLLELLETIEADARSDGASFFFPVQSVIRPEIAGGMADLYTGRAYAGQIASGAIEVGAEIVALPSGRRSRVQQIVTFDGDLRQAHAPMSVTLLLEDELDIGRGDAICAAENPPLVSRDVRATLIWFDEAPLDLNASFVAKHTTHTVRARVRRLLRIVDIESTETARATVAMNDIFVADLEMSEPLVVRSYAEDRSAGSFILMDRTTNATVAAGLVLQTVSPRGRASTSGRAHDPSSRVVAMRVVGFNDLSPELLQSLEAEGFIVLAAPADMAACTCTCHPLSHSPPCS